jgi:hypothetical protein
VFRAVPRDILTKGTAVELAARLLEPAREALGFSEHIVGDRDRRLHTNSITYEKGGRATRVGPEIVRRTHDG